MTITNIYAQLLIDNELSGSPVRLTDNSSGEISELRGLFNEPDGSFGVNIFTHSDEGDK